MDRRIVRSLRCLTWDWLDPSRSSVERKRWPWGYGSAHFRCSDHRAEYRIACYWRCRLPAKKSWASVPGLGIARVLSILGVEGVHRGHDLRHVVFGLRSFRLVLHAPECRKQQRHEDRDDCDHDEQFDQREAAVESRIFSVTSISASARGRDIACSRSRLASKSLRRSGAAPAAAPPCAGTATGADRRRRAAPRRSRFADSSGGPAARRNPARRRRSQLAPGQDDVGQNFSDARFADQGHWRRRSFRGERVVEIPVGMRRARERNFRAGEILFA